jgi:hypothetical protein
VPGASAPTTPREQDAAAREDCRGRPCRGDVELGRPMSAALAALPALALPTLPALALPTLPALALPTLPALALPILSESRRTAQHHQEYGQPERPCQDLTKHCPSLRAQRGSSLGDGRQLLS